MSDLVVETDFLAEAHAKFAAEIAAIIPPKVVGDADEQDLEEGTEYILACARVADRWLLKTGRYYAAATPDKLISADDLKQHFTDVLTGGLIGHATYVFNSAIEGLQKIRYGEGFRRSASRLMRGWLR